MGHFLSAGLQLGSGLASGLALELALGLASALALGIALGIAQWWGQMLFSWALRNKNRVYKEWNLVKGYFCFKMDDAT